MRMGGFSAAAGCKCCLYSSEILTAKQVRLFWLCENNFKCRVLNADRRIPWLCSQYMWSGRGVSMSTETASWCDRHAEFILSSSAGSLKQPRAIVSSI